MRRCGRLTGMVLIVSSIFWGGIRATAYSLWRGEKASETSIVRNGGAIEFKTHDLITILVEEKSSTSNDATLKSDKTYDIKLQQLDDLITMLTDRKLGAEEVGGTEGTYTAEKKTDQKASAGRDDEFQARITAEVMEVLPNGNLLLEARKKLTIYDEQQEITLTGTVRPEHVKTDYTVLSRYLANAAIEIKGEGPVARGGSKRGWLARLLDFVWPF